MDFFPFIVVAVAGYLLGSVPFAVIIAGMYSVDIFKAGSGNPGATNVKRTCGKTAGNLCFALDALKGFAAALLPALFPLLGFDPPGRGGGEYLPYVGLLAAVAGHSFSPFIGFRGGKGVSTAVGGLLGVMCGALLVSLLVWLAVFYSTKYVSLSSIAMAVALPVASAFLYPAGIRLYMALAICILVVVRHRSNIVRLLKGTENRF